jgi:hypothetical protein
VRYFLWSRLRTSFVNQRKYFHQRRKDVLRQARVYCSDGETESRRLLPAIFAISAADVTQLADR